MGIAYPAKDQVGKASQEQLARWYRFLPPPASDYQAEVMQLIVERFRGFTPELSKRIGWG